MARAIDRTGMMSARSESLAVVISAVGQPSKPVVAVEAVGSGAALRLYWSAIVSATRYEIRAGASVDTIETTYHVAVTRSRASSSPR